jgi:hypothetical protein
MSAEAIFDLANPLALLGWVLLAMSPLAPRLIQAVAGVAIPLLFAVVYCGLVLANWTSAEGGYGSLPEVMALFTNPGMTTAGWVHYLAFDLFVGAWIVRDARRHGIPHLAILPCLALTFLFGPAGLLAYAALRLVLAPRSLTLEI